MSTQNSIGVSLSGQTGTGVFCGATSPSLTTPNIDSATASSLTFSPTTHGVIGTTTNDNALAGTVGEFISSNISSGSAISVTTNTPKDLTSIVLTAGDWDLWGNFSFIFPATTKYTDLNGWTNTTSATAPDASLYSAIHVAAVAPGAGNTVGLSVPQIRYSIASNTTVYLSVNATFTLSTLTACGTISARRVR